MRRLVLIRHSTPVMTRDLPASDWRLSENGVARALDLARSFDPGSARAIFSSVEPKATGTALALGQVWDIPVETVRGLHEHERRGVEMLPRDRFDERMRELFAMPASVVFGEESAEAARRRFTAAVLRLIAGTTSDVVVVTHGTVLTLFVAGVTGMEPLSFWRRLAMPSAVVLSLPDFALRGVAALEGPDFSASR